MNMFWLHDDSEVSARLHCDRHVTKMCIEYAQILSTAAELQGFHDPDRMYEPIPNLNRKVHEWAAESADNFVRLLKMAKALGNEFEHRYGNHHASMVDVISEFDLTELNMDYVGATEPPLCMPDEYQVEGDVIKSYRNFYNHGKTWDLSWTKRDVPDWYIGEVRDYELRSA